MLRLVITATVVILATAMLVALWPRVRRVGADGAEHTGDDARRGRRHGDAPNPSAHLAVSPTHSGNERDGPTDALADSHADGEDSFDVVRSSLVPQLVPASEIDDEQVHLDHVARTDLPGLMTLLAYDAPGLRGHVRRDESDRWLRDDGELFDVAMRNLRAHPGLPTPVAVDLESGPTVHVIQGASPLIASMALILSDLAELIGDHGVLVAVPTQRVMLIHTLGDAPVLNAIARMIPMVLHHHSQGPDALVTDLFWQRHGSFVRLPYELRDSTLALRPPEEFVALMHRLDEG